MRTPEEMAQEIRRAIIVDRSDQWFAALLAAWRDECVGETAKQMAEVAALKSLVDGAEETVELFGYRSEHPAQKTWAKDWLAKARALLRAKGDE